jgi:O-antigen ligase
LTRFPVVREARVDVLAALVVYAIALVAIPSELIVGPLGAAGTPAQIIGIGMAAWWLISHIARKRSKTRTNPVKWLLLVFAIAILASYVAGMSRPITFSEEVSSADRALLSLCAWCGVALFIADGIGSLNRLNVLLKVVASGVCGIAILGIIQFLFNLDIAHIIQIPGLTANHQFGELIERSAYRRVTGTTSHPIEFGVVLSAALPLAIHYGRFSATRTQRRRWWLATIVIAVALPLSVARSGILGALVVAIYLFYTWPPRLKVKMLMAGVAGAVAMSFLVPGLLGTIKSLFLNASSDPSTQGRTADYAPVERYTAQHPLFGRGFGTFIPSLYRTLDNQLLGTLVETGIIGLLALLLLFIGTGCVAGAVRRHSPSEQVRDLGQSLKAGIAAIAINFATFDALGFAMCAGMLFVLVGATGSLWAIERPAGTALKSPAHPLTPGRMPRRSLVPLMAVIVAVLVGLGAWGVMDAKPEYQAYGTVLVTPPPSPGQLTLASAGNANMMTSIVHDVLVSPPVREKLRPHAATYEVAVGNGSLTMDTDVEGLESPRLRFLATADTASRADAALAAVLRETTSQLNRLQAIVGVEPGDMLRPQVIQQLPAYPVYGRPTRAHVTFALLVVIAFAALYHTTRRRRSPRSTGSARPSDDRRGVITRTGSINSGYRLVHFGLRPGPL